MKLEKGMKELFDYRNNLKRILMKTAGDDKSLQNGLAAIKAIINMADDGQNTPAKAVKTKPAKNIAQVNHSNKEVRKLILQLAKLIENPGDKTAKSASLSALHKLTFEPGMGKNYGDVLGKLDQAIQKSTPTSEAVNKKIFEDAVKPKKTPKRDYRKGRRYTVIRLVTGADLINDNGETVYTVKESQVHPLNLKTGDVVEALEDKINPNYEAEILRVVGFRNLRKRDYDQVAEFKYGVVQGRPGSFAITRNIRGEKLRIRGKSVVIPVDSSYYQGESVQIEDGSIVDLAWYEGDVRLKKNPADAVQIRWIYQTQQPKRVQNTKKKKEKLSSENELSKLDMDLHYQRVGIAVGDNQNEAMLESIVNRYNGIPIPIDAFEGKKK